MQEWKKPKCTVLMKREKNKIQRLNKVVRLWWGKKKAPRSCWRIITANAVKMISDELVRSLLVNAPRKTLQRGADISSRQGRWNGAGRVTLLLTLQARSRAQTHQAQPNVPFTRVLFFCDMTWSPEWLFSLDLNTGHESEWWKSMIHCMDFSLNQAMWCINFSANLLGDVLWSLDLCPREKPHWSCELRVPCPCGDLCAAVTCMITGF